MTGNIHKTPEVLKTLKSLPTSCHESAKLLLEERHLYERDGFFQPQVINYIAELLQNENDEFLSSRLNNFSPNDKLVEGRKIMHRDIHRH